MRQLLFSAQIFIFTQIFILQFSLLFSAMMLNVIAASGQRYAVDSWFYDNGLPATFMPFGVRKSSCIPADSAVGHLRGVSHVC